MGCGHDWHGCGPWYGGPYGRRWSEPAEWHEEVDWPVRRRSRGDRRIDRETGIEGLEVRLAELLNEVRRLEAEIVSLRGADQATTERP